MPQRIGGRVVRLGGRVFRPGKWIVTGVVCASLLVTAAPRAQQPIAVATSRSTGSALLGLNIVAADVALPPGQWEVAGVTPANTLEQIFLTAAAGADPAARRIPAAEIQRNLNSGSYHVSQFYPAISAFAQTHAGIGPSTATEIATGSSSYLMQMFGRSPWDEEAGRPVPGPFFFLIPSQPITAPANRGGGNVSRTPVLLELRPYVGDGKQWVLYADGHTERVQIDQALVTKYNLVIRPVRPATPAAASDPNAPVRYALHGVLKNATASSATLTLADAFGGRTLEVRWSLQGGRLDSQLLTEWADARSRSWRALADGNDAPVLETWLARSRFLYGGGPSKADADPFLAMMRARRTTDTLGVLGGRAALRETLQMDAIGATTTVPGGDARVPIGSLKGVEVKSLPFETMLAGKTGGRIGLADRVPADRLLIYFAKPSAVFPFLETGGDFLARAGSLYTASAFDDNLKGRYLRRLGLAEGAGKAFLESGAVTDLAFVASDLFFLDGTDLTLIMRMRAPGTIAGALRLLGVVDLPAEGVTEKPTPNGRAAYWARQGDVLTVSTSRAELDSVLKLGADPNARSLGRSAEFQYLLTELPMKTETRALVYMSDPFIRRMVGPAMKIGQLRRLRARSEMTVVTAGALLYRLDGHRDTPTLARLIELGYVADKVKAGNYVIRPDFSVASPRWGTLADTAAIDTAAIDFASQEEAQAYQSYMDNYRNFWRQFFDPIAMRLDDAAGDQLELTTFILPLVDSDLYNGVRGFLQSKERGARLKVPVVTPAPVTQLSINLTEEAWVNLSGEWSRTFSEYTGISPEVFDLLGPGLHIAIQDADPIITVGTGDMLGAFGGPMFGRGMDMMIPFALSVFTRPVKIFVELQDPQKALALLRQATARAPRSDMRPEGVQFRQIEGKDAWIFSMGVPGVVTLRLGLEIQNGFLVFSNVPWTKPVTMQRVDTLALNGASIQIAPQAIKEGLPGLFATQAEHDQRSALSSMAALLPLLQAVSATPDEAAALHTTLFGSTPLHPKTGAWVWKNGRLESSSYGSAMRWKVPMYRPEMGDFGLFENATLLDLNMQFESGGLRATAKWKWKN